MASAGGGSRERAQPASRSRNDLLALPFEARAHVLKALQPVDLLRARLSCLTLHATAADCTIWRDMASHLLRGHPHLVAPPLYPRLGVVESQRWFFRLRWASEDIRFLRNSRRDEIVGDLKIPSFGTIHAQEFDRSRIGSAGLCAHGGELDNLNEHRAEICLSAAVGPITVTIEMPNSEQFAHFIYLRRGADGCVCYWSACDPGLYHLHISGDRCHLRKPEEKPEQATGEAIGDDDFGPGAVGDLRLLDVDPEWRPDCVPRGVGQLYVGLTLFNGGQHATMRRVQLH